jgi:hypothetical protein
VSFLMCGAAKLLSWSLLFVMWGIMNCIASWR